MSGLEEGKQLKKEEDKPEIATEPVEQVETVEGGSEEHAPEEPQKEEEKKEILIVEGESKEEAVSSGNEGDDEGNKEEGDIRKSSVGYNKEEEVSERSDEAAKGSKEDEGEIVPDEKSVEEDFGAPGEALGEQSKIIIKVEEKAKTETLEELLGLVGEEGPEPVKPKEPLGEDGLANKVAEEGGEAEW